MIQGRVIRFPQNLKLIGFRSQEIKQHCDFLLLATIHLDRNIIFFFLNLLTKVMEKTSPKNKSLKFIKNHMYRKIQKSFGRFHAFSYGNFFMKISEKSILLMR